MADSEQSYFCLEEISAAKNLIVTLSAQLPILRQNYDKYKGTGYKKEQESIADLHRCVKRLLEIFPDLIQQLNEYGDTALSETTSKLYTVLKKFDYLGNSDYGRLCRALDVFSEQLPREDHQINSKALAHLMNRVRMGYFPTDEGHVELIKKAMLFPSDKVNIFDPCCGEGLALERFANGVDADTYGTEIDTVRAEEAQSRLGRVGFGSFFHSRISSNAFQCVWLNPPYMSAPSENGNRRLEKSFLADSIRLLQDDGILIYIIPYYRATPDICRVLCENFTDLRVYRFMGKEYERYHQVVFLCRKIPRREAFKQTERLSEYMLKAENIPELCDISEGVYTVPVANKKVDIFKGAEFNISELAIQLKNSDSINRMFAERSLDNRCRQPLLPLNLSQIGLVGASGMMNGLIDCDTPHIIKGRVVKEKKTHVIGENDKGNTEIRETTSNKLIFNILTPSGFKSLG